MRKSFLVAVAAMTAVVFVNSNVFVQAGTQNCNQKSCQVKGYVISGNRANCEEELKKVLSDLNINLNNENLGNCPNGSLSDCLNGNLSKCPKSTCPNIKAQIIVPGKCTPQTQEPEMNQPDISVPETNQSDVDNSETQTGQPQPPETQRPDVEETTTKSESKSESDNKESAFIQRVVELVNQERAKAGLGKVVLDEKIQNAAMIRVKEIEVSFSHTRPNGSSFSSVLKENGIQYSGAGENIAWGQTSPEAVMEAWMNSDGHRANILNANFKKIGVGYYKNSAGRKYWSQLFVY